MFADPSYSGPIENTKASTIDFWHKANANQISVRPEDINRMFDIYESQIRRVDDFIRTTVENLERLNLLHSTMLIITSDHGEQFYEFGHFGHWSEANCFADVSTRVPLIVYCPVLQPQGPIDGFTESIDIPSTILDALGIAIPNTFQGRSLFPVLTEGMDSRPPERKQIFYAQPRYLGVRTNESKLIYNLSNGKIQLFDLIADPHERINISDDQTRIPEKKDLISRIPVN